MDLVLVREVEVNNRCISDFIEFVKEGSFQYNSEDLRVFGRMNQVEVEEAVYNAKFTCSLAGLDLSWHFHDYYISAEGQLQHAWKLSKTAFLLSFIKAHTISKEAAFLQTEMVEDIPISLVENIKVSPARTTVGN